MKTTQTIKSICLMGTMLACQTQSDFREDQQNSPNPTTSPPVETVDIHRGESEDTLSVTIPGVIFFTPPREELDRLNLDESTMKGLEMAVGDFAYYASLVADSIKTYNIPVVFTEKPFISFLPNEDMVVERDQQHRMMGVAIYDGTQPPRIIYGLQTHLALWATIKDYFQGEEEVNKPLLQYFEPISERDIHVYASHSEILNQTGDRLNSHYHSLFGDRLARKASKYRMGLFAYYKFPIGTGLTGLVCRVPSRYDESAINLYLWDDQAQTVIGQIPLAENVWDDHSILVMDSWIRRASDDLGLEIIQRRKEASIDSGHRTETDSLYRWRWTEGGFRRAIAQNLDPKNFPLKDWASHEDVQPVRTEISVVDNEFVWLPLETGDLSWENLMMTIPKQYELIKEPIPNKFNQQQVDTLVTLEQPHLRLQFYRTPQENLILSGRLSDQSVIFKNGLRVGLTKQQLKTLFPQLPGNDAIPDLVLIKSRYGDRVFTCRFQQDTLATIEITNYIH